MERYDMYCQICNHNIYNAITDWMFSRHYYCQQDLKNWTLVKSVYPVTKFEAVLFDNKIKEIILNDIRLSEDYAQNIIEHIRASLEGNGITVHIIGRYGRGMGIEKIELVSKTFFKEFVFENGAFAPKRRSTKLKFDFELKEIVDNLKMPQSLHGLVTWYEHDKKAEYYKSAGLILHKTHPQNGRNIVDYNFCPDCAEKLGYKCDQCGGELKIVNH